MPSLIIKATLSHVPIVHKTWLQPESTNASNFNSEGTDSGFLNPSGQDSGFLNPNGTDSGWLGTEDGTPDFNTEGQEKYIS